MLARMFERRFHVSQQPPGWVVQGYGMESVAGEDVTPELALNVSAVYACITILAETLASLPLILYRRKERGKERAIDHPLYSLMHDAPNPEHSSMVYREIGQGHLGGWGNHYGQIIRNGRGGILEIWPMRPDRMTGVERVNGRRVYTYKRNGLTPTNYSADQILHVPAFGLDGLMGMSPIENARNAIGVAIAAEKYGGQVFANGARPSLVLEHPNMLGGGKEGAKERFIKEWNDNFGGPDKAGKTALAEEGMKVHEIGFPPEAAQFIETRRNQVIEISRWYHMPLSLLGEHDKAASYASVEQFLLSFVVHTIRPWAVRWEQELQRQLLTKEERTAGYYFEFLLDALLRGDTATRFEAYAKGMQNGTFSINNVLSRENMDPIEDEAGEWHWMPQNMLPIQKFSQMQTQAGGNMEPPARNTKPFRRLYADALKRCMNVEINDVRNGAPKHFKKGDFDDWLTEFYRGHTDFMVRQLLPVALAHAELVEPKWTDEERAAQAQTRLSAFAEAFTAKSVLALSHRTMDAVEQILSIPRESAIEFLVDELLKENDHA